MYTIYSPENFKKLIHDYMCYHHKFLNQQNEQNEYRRQFGRVIKQIENITSSSSDLEFGPSMKMCEQVLKEKVSLARSIFDFLHTPRRPVKSRPHIQNGSLEEQGEDESIFSMEP